MEAVKRIEIIANSRELDKVLEVLNRMKAPGYTVVRSVVGKGSRGMTTDDLLDTSTNNFYVICFCPEAVAAAIAQSVKPVLDRFGGICCISDALQIRPS